MARTKTKDKEQLEITERQILAVELRKTGLSYRAIGTRLNISHEQVRRDVEGELQRLVAERNSSLESYRQLELERLDKITKALDHWVEAGNPMAINSYLRCMERRAKLLGLDVVEEKANGVEIVIRHENNNPAYTIQPPSRYIESPGKVQNNSHREKNRENDAGETVH